jgi:hypothetical protein
MGKALFHRSPVVTGAAGCELGACELGGACELVPASWGPASWGHTLCRGRPGSWGPGNWDTLFVGRGVRALARAVHFLFCYH